jgi:hypothetical protein
MQSLAKAVLRFDGPNNKGRFYLTSICKLAVARFCGVISD